MIIRYARKHEQLTWQGKMESIFGKPKSEDPVVEDDYEWTPGESLNRLNEPSFKENIKKM